MRLGQKAGGYPQSDTSGVNATTGLVESVVDTDYLETIKTQEVAKGCIETANTISLSSLSIRVDAQAWIEINDGTQIGVHPDDGFFSIDVQEVNKLIFKNVVGFKIAYTY